MASLEFLKGLLANLFVLLALVTLSGWVRGWFMRQRRTVPPWQSGLLFGAMATIAMFFPIATHTDMYFDCRAGVIGTAAFMGGPIAALASIPLPLLYRLYLQGPGMIPGLLEILLPAIFGTVCHFWCGKKYYALSVPRVILASVVIAAEMNAVILTLVMFFMPASNLNLGWPILILVLVNPAVTMSVLGSLILLEQKHFNAVQTLADNERRMRHSQKMAAIGQLSRKVAHSFVNTLTVILGNAQIAKDNAGDVTEVRQYMDEIIEASGRLSYLTGELLAFANPAPLRMRVIDVCKCVVGVKELLSRTIGPEVEVIIDSDEKVGKANVDLDQIAQAIVHMAINADEAMPDGGRFIVKTEAVSLTKAEKVELQVGTHARDRHQGEFALLSIEDTGCGMGEETCSRMFEPFFTTKEKKENAGLGLATVYNIVSQHNGYIEVKSRLGQGTTFLIYLPLITPDV